MIRAPSRRPGVAVVGVLVLVFLLGAAGFATMRFANQSRRASDWYYRSQAATNLAHVGLRETLIWLQWAQNPAQVEAEPDLPLSPGLLATLTVIQGSDSGGQVTLMEADAASAAGDPTLPDVVRQQLATLADLDPTITVRIEIAPPVPLPREEFGFAPDPQENQTLIRLVATASIASEVGPRVERTVTVQTESRSINLLPEPLGRFALWIERAPESSPLNQVPMVLQDDSTAPDEPATWGSASLDPTRSWPLVLRQPLTAPIVDTATRLVQRSSLVDALDPASALDVPGWVYLGGSQPWDLDLAHGWGEGGEAFLLPGHWQRVQFGHDPAQDAAFRDRIQAAAAAAGTACTIQFDQPDHGLYHLVHGFADRYESIGVEAGRRQHVRDPSGRKAIDFGDRPSSLLRLLGDGPAPAPTLVFGPVRGRMIRKAQLRAALRAGTGPGNCSVSNSADILLYRYDEHDSVARDLVQAGFGSPAEFEQFGTALVEDQPWMRRLATLLDPRGAGRWAPSGELFTTPGTEPEVVPFGSQLLPWLDASPVPGEDEAAEDEVLERFWSGEVDAPAFFTRPLSEGLQAFSQLLVERVSHNLPADLVPAELFDDGGALRLPGIVLVTDVSAEAPLVLPSVPAVERGGVLVVLGAGIEITGDILRQGAGDEPLVLVATGDIRIADGVERVRAGLISTQGTVRFPANDLTITGFLAARELDVAGLSQPGRRRIIEYDPALDPTDPGAREAAYRVVHRTDVAVSVDGGG